MTVLGSAKSGKTTLINAFISHSFLAVPEENSELRHPGVDLDIPGHARNSRSCDARPTR